MRDVSLPDVYRQKAAKGESLKDVRILKAFIPDEIRRPAAKEIEALGAGSDRVLQFKITTGAVDRDRDTINPKGWLLDNYRKTGPVLWAHDYDIPPVARALSVDATGDALISVAEFVPADISPFADMIYKMLVGKFLSGTSVGFSPVDGEFAYNETRKGVDFQKQELLEYSIVPIPSNPEALMLARSKGVDIRPLREWAEKVLDKAIGGPGVWIPKAQAEAAYRATRAGKTISAPDPATLLKAGLELIAKRIVSRDGQFCVVTEDGTKTLGCHDTREGAVEQLQAVEANKGKTLAVEDVVLPLESVRTLCPTCAEKMEFLGLTGLKVGDASVAFRAAFAESRLQTDGAVFLQTVGALVENKSTDPIALVRAVHLKLTGTPLKQNPTNSPEKPADIKPLFTTACPHCGAASQSSFKYCPACGNKLSGKAAEPVAKMACGKCGAENGPGRAYCEKCGAAMKAAPEYVVTFATPDEKEAEVSVLRVFDGDRPLPVAEVASLVADGVRGQTSEAMRTVRMRLFGLVD